jgi:hypothetical protein
VSVAASGIRSIGPELVTFDSPRLVNALFDACARGPLVALCSRLVIPTTMRNCGDADAYRRTSTLCSEEDQHA